MDKNIKEFLTDKVGEKGVVAMIEEYGGLNLHRDDEEWINEAISFLDECANTYYSQQQCDSLHLDCRIFKTGELILSYNKRLYYSDTRCDFVRRSVLDKTIRLPAEIYEDTIVRASIVQNLPILLKKKIMKKKPSRLQQVFKFFSS